MKFRDPNTGKVFDEIDSTKCYSNRKCLDCPLDVEHNGYKEPCRIFVRDHPEEAARLIGYEVIEDDGCDSNWSETGKQFYKSLLKPDENIGDTPTEADDTPTETHDNVDHPAHYNQGGVECIDALKAATVGLEGIQAFCAANAIKYIWRFKDKNGTEDLDKAIWYIQRLKEEIGNG